MSTSNTHAPSVQTQRIGRMLLVHGLGVPALLATIALFLHYSGWDQRISAALFDPGLQQFPARQWPGFDLLGHRIAKSIVFGLWFVLLGAALAAPKIERLRAHRSLLWASVAAMAIGPTVVVALKSLNSIHCPWDLKPFGGTADFTYDWFVSAADAGRCFPGGHAAGGFSLAALYFAGWALDHATLRRAGLAATLIAGVVFSAVRVMQGAHFVSHNLWAAAIDWSTAAIVFAVWAMQQRTRTPARLTP